MRAFHGLPQYSYSISNVIRCVNVDVTSCITSIFIQSRGYFNARKHILSRDSYRPYLSSLLSCVIKGCRKGPSSRTLLCFTTNTIYGCKSFLLESFDDVSWFRTCICIQPIRQCDLFAMLHETAHSIFVYYLKLIH